MNRKYFTVAGRKYIIDFFCTIEDGKTFVEIKSEWSSHIRHLKVYYRPERTWDDRMGNTPCGYYVNVPLHAGHVRRVYMH